MHISTPKCVSVCVSLSLIYLSLNIYSAAVNLLLAEMHTYILFNNKPLSQYKKA